MRSARFAVAGLVLVAGASGIALLFTTERRQAAFAGPAVLATHAVVPEEPAQSRSEPKPSEERRSVAPEAPMPAIDARTREPRAPEAAAEKWTVTLIGRVVDERGAPIEGAELETHDGVLRARSDAEGHLLALEEASAPWPTDTFGGMVVLEVCAAGHTCHSLGVSARNGATLHLGMLVLADGADVLGVVRDEAGLPVVEAYVSLYDAADWPQDEGRAREEGIEARGSTFLQATTDELGRYRLRGAPQGELFLSAEAEGRQLTWSPPFVLRAGEDVTRDLVLASDGMRLARWTIRVLDPRGDPVPRARVLISGGVVNSSYTSFPKKQQEQADDEGKVTFQVQAGEEHVVSASDPEERWRPSPKERRRAAEDASFEVVLREPVFLTIVVADELERPIPWSTVKILLDRSGQRDRPTGADGSLGVLLPDELFRVQAFAPGFADATFGPFDPTTLGLEQPLVLRLSPGRAVGGRVLARRQPVANAAIVLRWKSAPDTLWVSSEITSVETPFFVTTLQHGGRATTDEAGAFVVSVREDGWYTVVVEASGFPTQAFGPFEVHGAASLAHDLTLAHGGAIEGRLVLPPGESTSERLVGASNGSGLAFTTPVDSEGRYRIEELAPGGYQVRGCHPPAARAHSLVMSEQAGMGEPVLDCVVREGATTRFDLDLAAEGSVVLNGSFQVPGGEQGWVFLTRVGETHACARTLTDEAGRFRLAISRAGRFSLGIRGWTSSGSTSFLQAPIALVEGEQEWSAKPDWGRVCVVLGARGAELLGGGHLVLTWRGAQESSYEAELRHRFLSDGETPTLSFPAGQVEVLRVEESLREPLREPFTLLAGETVVLDLTR